MKVVKPLIVFGTGRSGTTVFQNMFAHHPNLAWLSKLSNRYPGKPEMNRYLMNLMQIPVFGTMLRKKFKPAEVYNFWEYYCKGFSRPCRDLLSVDVTHKNKERILNVTEKVLTRKRNRLLVKITGWPRIGFLNTIFNDAKFIHIVRDGRAVANSLINIGFWWGWRGPENWRWGTLSDAYLNEWNRYDRSFIVLAAIQWKIQIDAIEKATKELNENNFLEIKYEELCHSPVDIFRKVVEFSELEWTNGFERAVMSYKLKSANDRWKQELNDKQKQDLNESVLDYLNKYNYV